MLKLSFLTIHPEFINVYAKFGVFRSATEQKLAEIGAVDLRQFSLNDYGSVDDRPYGGGDGMVMSPEPLARAVQSLPEAPLVVMTSPGAEPWRAIHARQYSVFDRPIVFVCGRFSGIDQRFLDQFVHADFSVGDFVVSGGELPALMMADSILREIPGVLGHVESAKMDSFAEGFAGKLEHPLYTRPKEFGGQTVPDVLLSGDHKKISQWRSSEALRRTIERRFDLVDSSAPKVN